MGTEFEPLGGAIYPDTREEQLRALEADEQLLDFRARRAELAEDRYRPLYHFSPPGGNMNDPNGLCQWRGQHHLFYQFTPPEVGRVHWGHAVSDDLVHWQDLPIALYPTTERDCFSGQTLVEDERVIAIYHGTQSGNAIATAGDPLLLNWEKHPRNPVIPIVPVTPEGEPYRVFDPCIWREDDGYYSLSGTYAGGERGIDCRNVDHLFRSSDLAQWEHLGALIEDGFHTEPGEDGAVPNLWPIGDGRHMLLFFSHKRAAQYYVGRYDRETHRLIPERHGRLAFDGYDRGGLHAPSATIDDAGRFLAIFNLRECAQTRGWFGMMSLPWHLWLAPDHSVRMAPVSGLQSLRFDHRQAPQMEIPANDDVLLDGIGGSAMEIELRIDPGSAREVGLTVLRSPGGEEQTTITLYLDAARHRPERSRLGIDLSRGSLRPDVFARTPEIGPLALEDGEPLALRVFIDRGCIEVFAADRLCLTARAYPDRDDSTGVSVFARGGAAQLLALDAWQMRSIWPELQERQGR